jgi:RNA polymerase sigma-70 factor (ECF subfamily)
VKSSGEVHKREASLPIQDTDTHHGAGLNAPQLLLTAPPPFEAVFAEQSRFAWRLLVRLGVQERDAADVCQEVFLVIHRRLAEFDPARSGLTSWVSGICVRAASDYRRRHPNRRETSDGELESMAVSGEQHHELEKRRAWLKLQRALDAMDAGKSEVFVLYELEALPMSEIATILGCPVQTAYSRLHAARQLVMLAFAAEGEP